MDKPLKPQLAEKVPGKLKDTLTTYLQDPNWIVTEKVDGHRRLVVNDGGPRLAILGRDGQNVVLPTSVRKALDAIPGTWALDGELADGVLWIFDLAIPDVAYQDRRDQLEKLATYFEDPVRLLPWEAETEAKTKLAMRVYKAGGEGIMLNHVEGLYCFGKRSRKVLKAKFVQTIDCFVTELSIDGKQNVGLGVYDDNGNVVDIGTCIIHAKESEQVEVGSVVTVDYLYVVDPRHPRLVQPTRLRVRHDKAPEECLLSQARIRYTTKKVVSADAHS